MGRINPNDIDRYDNTNNSEWLKLQNDGDVARVQFLYKNYNELDTYACHRVPVGDTERYVDCKRNYDSPLSDCPFCEAGFQVKPVMILSMYDHSDGKVKIWERGKTFRKKLEALFNRYPNLSNMVFEIERRGAKGDKKTQYEIFPMPDVEPVDVSQIEKPEFIGSFILDKTPDEMQYYINNGVFPQNENEADSEPIRRRTTDNSSEISHSRRGRRVGN